MTDTYREPDLRAENAVLRKRVAERDARIEELESWPDKSARRAAWAYRGCAVLLAIASAAAAVTGHWFAACVVSLFVPMWWWIARLALGLSPWSANPRPDIARSLRPPRKAPRPPRVAPSPKAVKPFPPFAVVPTPKLASGKPIGLRALIDAEQAARRAIYQMNLDADTEDRALDWLDEYMCEAEARL